METKDFLRVNAGGSCGAVDCTSVNRIATVPPNVRPAQRDVRPQLRSRTIRVPKPTAEDFAPWVMRFLALALVLFVFVVLALHG